MPAAKPREINSGRIIMEIPVGLQNGTIRYVNVRLSPYDPYSVVLQLPGEFHGSVSLPTYLVEKIAEVKRGYDRHCLITSGVS